MPLFRLLKDYKDGAFKKGQIIAVASQKRLNDMNRGYGEPYVPPEPEPEKKKVIKKKPSAKRNSKGKFQSNK